MTSATCPSCGKALMPGAVLCVQCGFDLRTGQKLTTEVISGAVGHTRPEGQQKFAREKYQICQMQGLSTKILVCDDNEEVVAYIHGRAHPLWTCFTVVVAVPLFFLVPVGLGFLFFVVAEQAEIPAPGMLLAIVLTTLAIAAGLLASLCMAGLMTPRRRLTVWEDESQRELLMRVVETWKFGVARVSVIGADGQPQGRILHHRRRNRYMLMDRFDQPQAVLLPEKIGYTSEWATQSLMSTLLLFLLFGLPGILLAVLPKKERSYSEWFLHRLSSLQEQPTEKIGRVTFNPVREYPYRVELTDDLDHIVDRQLIVGLMGLLEW